MEPHWIRVSAFARRSGSDGRPMNPLLSLSRAIDLVSERLGRLAAWGVLLSCLVSAGNATIRYVLNASSNAWLELQWYLFAVTVMLGAAHVLKVNEHVRVDVLYGGRSGTTKAVIDLLGMLFFVLPVCLLMVWLSWPWFVDSYVHHELSSNAGGLLRWPVKLLVPLGFGMLALQVVSEVIKRVAFLTGRIDMDTHYERPLQ